MRTYFALLIMSLCLGTNGFAGELVRDNADPLAKFSDEDLADPGFCFNKFADAVKSGDAVLAKALTSSLPKALSSASPTTPAGKEQLIKGLAKYAGAQAVKSMKMPAAGLATVTYADSKGAEHEARMSNEGGRWKIVVD